MGMAWNRIKKKEEFAMIYGTLDHIDRYAPMGPRLYKGLKFLAETNFTQLADGRHELEGDDLFVNVMTVETRPRPAGEVRMEAHDRYLDIQCVVQGEEVTGVAPRGGLTVEEPRPEGDILFLRGNCTWLPLGESRRQFLVVYPEDAHAPTTALTTPDTVRRAVVKMRLD